MMSELSLKQFAEHVDGCTTCTNAGLMKFLLCAKGRQILAWSIACAEAGSYFIGLQPGVPEGGIEAQILLTAPTGSTVCIPISQMSPRAVEEKLAAHQAKYAGYESSTEHERRLRGSQGDARLLRPEVA